MWRQVVAQSPGKNAPSTEVLRYDVGWKALNTLLKSGRSLSGHERNCCFLNTRGQRFADISAVGDIDFDDDGRVLAPSDWDLDGDIDFWISNRTGPQVRFLRNDHDNDCGFVAFKLEGTTCNRDAIGAHLALHVGDSHEAPVRYKTVRAGEGYISQSSKWVHYGLGQSKDLTKLVVRWPDGKTETISGIAPGGRYAIKQGKGKAEKWTPPTRQVALSPTKIVVPTTTDQARVGLISPVPIPQIKYATATGDSRSIIKEGKPRLINLWATWCEPCIKELKEWKKHHDRLERSGVEIIAVNVDEAESSAAERDKQIIRIAKIAEEMSLPFKVGFASKELGPQFDVLQRSILRRQRALPIPSSFLVDGDGQLRVIYKGPVSAAQISKDVKLIGGSSEDAVAASIPFEGIWLGQPSGSSPNQIAVRFIEGGFIKEAEGYVRQLAAMDTDNPLYNRAEATVLLGALLLDQKRLKESAAAFKDALKLDPKHRQSHIELAGILMKLEQPSEAATHFEAALERRPNDPELRIKLGEARLKSGRLREAVKQFRKSSELRESAVAHHNCGNALLAMKNETEAIKEYGKALQVDGQFTPSANNLAWLLSTSPIESNRDGSRAVKLAEQVLGQVARKTFSQYDTLAAAYAEAGRFDDAVKAAEQAAKLAKAAGETKNVQEIESRLKSFREQKPFRDR